MFKSIFVPTTGFSSDPTALETALSVARIFGGHLDCTHVRPDPSQILIQAAGYDMGMGASSAFAVGDIAAVLQEEDRKRCERARQVFDAFCLREKPERVDNPPCSRRPSAAWNEITGREADVLIAQMRIHDLTVIGHPSSWSGLTRDIAASMLVGGGRPLLLAAAKAPALLGDTIAIAWKDTPEAARAVTAAMPFLDRAKRIVVINVAEHENVTVEGAEALARNLRWHNVPAEVRYLANPSGSMHDTILTIAREEGADMLVMGGYGHTRLSEFIFGGFTRHVLAGAEMPILMAH